MVRQLRKELGTGHGLRVPPVVVLPPVIHARRHISLRALMGRFVGEVLDSRTHQCEFGCSGRRRRIDAPRRRRRIAERRSRSRPAVKRQSVLDHRHGVTDDQIVVEGVPDNRGERLAKPALSLLDARAARSARRHLRRHRTPAARQHRRPHHLTMGLPRSTDLRRPARRPPQACPRSVDLATPGRVDDGVDLVPGLRAGLHGRAASDAHRRIASTWPVQDFGVPRTGQTGPPEPRALDPDRDDVAV